MARQFRLKQGFQEIRWHPEITSDFDWIIDRNSTGRNFGYTLSGQLQLIHPQMPFSFGE